MGKLVFFVLTISGAAYLFASSDMGTRALSFIQSNPVESINQIGKEESNDSTAVAQSRSQSEQRLNELEAAVNKLLSKNDELEAQVFALLNERKNAQPMSSTVNAKSREQKKQEQEPSLIASKNSVNSENTSAPTVPQVESPQAGSASELTHEIASNTPSEVNKRIAQQRTLQEIAQRRQLAAIGLTASRSE